MSNRKVVPFIFFKIHHIEEIFIRKFYSWDTNDMRNSVRTVGILTVWGLCYRLQVGIDLFKVPIRSSTLGSALLTLLEASLELTLVMLSSIAWGSALTSAVSSKRVAFTWIVIFWNRNMLQGAKLGDSTMLGTDSMLFSVTNCWKDEAVSSGMLAWRRSQSWVLPFSMRFLVISSLKRLCTSLILLRLSSLMTFTQFFHIFVSPTWRWATRISKILNPCWVTFESLIPIKGLCPQDVM